MAHIYEGGKRSDEGRFFNGDKEVVKIEQNQIDALVGYLEELRELHELNDDDFDVSDSIYATINRINYLAGIST